MPTTRTVHRPPLIIGLLLLLLAAVTAWDANSMEIRANFGVGADAASYLVAVMLALLALCHVVVAFRGAGFEADRIDTTAVAWVGLALLGLVGTLWVGGGFILGTTLLFAFTARAFGRRALLVDLLIGAGLGLVIFLLFHGLLTLALPQGPLERLI